MVASARELPGFVPRPGDVVAGRYRIDSVLGQGGFGVVFKAEQLALGRSVALKMLLPEAIQHDQGLSRFRREAQLAQRLEHPHTVRLYDFGQTDLGLPYIAFELLRGRGLDEALRQDGPMPAARVAHIVAQVLKSLMEAHALGIIHRDIKPPNIFLCDIPGERDFVKVLDFGIAKPTTSNATVLTQAGLSLGTPPFMSPEQVRGETLGPPSDLYSLGLLMAELLTGRMVYEGTATDVFMEQISPRPVPLPESLRYSPLAGVLFRATEKDLTRRYASAEQMLRDLEVVMASGALGAGPSTPPLQHRAPQPMTEIGPGAQRVPAAHPPTMPATRVAGGAPRNQKLGVLFALLGVIALIASVAIFMIVRSPAADDDDEPKKKKKKIVHAVDDDDSKKKAKTKDPVDAKTLKSHMEDLGWKVIGESNNKTGDTTISTCTGQKGTQFAFVYIYDMPNSASADAIETSIKSQKGSAFKREGNRLLWVLTSPPDVPLARRLVTDLEP